MEMLLKNIKLLAVVIGICFSVYFYFDSVYAKADEVAQKASQEEVTQLASKVDHTALGLKIIILENMLDKRRDQLKEAQKAGATDLANSIRVEINDIERRIALLERKALE